MSISAKAVTCPKCGADIQAEEGHDKIFCTYCGAQLVVSNDNEYVYRYVDEAEVKKAETEHFVSKKNAELFEKEQMAQNRVLKVKIIASIILGILSIIFFCWPGENFGGDKSTIGLICCFAVFCIWIFDPVNNDKKQKKLVFDGRIKIPEDAFDYEKRPYMVIESLFVCAGFKNVKCIPLCDLKSNNSKKNNWTETVTVNGEEIDDVDARYSPDSSVIITYHSSTQPVGVYVPPRTILKKCSYCGSSVNQDSNFCPMCGKEYVPKETTNYVGENSGSYKL